MVKHLIGFGLFLLIVSFFAIAFTIFNLPPIPSLDHEVSPLAKLPTDCNFGPLRRTGQTRAIADRSTGEVTLYINSLPEDREVSEQEINARFTFFVLRDDQARLVDTINDSLVIKVTRDNDTKWILRYKADWITQLSRNDTVYVIPGVVDGSAAAFAKDRAISVLIRN